ncbi:hypothetical protein Dimus_023627 [Dionaea muscipula]
MPRPAGMPKTATTPYQFPPSQLMSCVLPKLAATARTGRSWLVRRSFVIAPLQHDVAVDRRVRGLAAHGAAIRARRVAGIGRAHGIGLAVIIAELPRIGRRLLHQNGRPAGRWRLIVLRPRRRASRHTGNADQDGQNDGGSDRPGAIYAAASCPEVSAYAENAEGCGPDGPDPIRQYQCRFHLRADAGSRTPGPSALALRSAAYGPARHPHLRPRASRGRAPRGGSHFTFGPMEELDLSTMDVILMRQDPPFDMAYITATHMLEHIHPKTLVVNDPAAVRNAPEKLLVTHFPDLMPPTLITWDRAAISEFRAEFRDIIIKPLFGNGGIGVFRVKEDDENFGSILDSHFARTTEPLMIQRYEPAVRQGDKRIILVDGVAAGAVNRVPAAGDARSNMHVGGRPEKSTLTAREQEICAKIGPYLKENGLIFVGIDVIGDYLTEINVTSPTGLQEIARFDAPARPSRTVDLDGDWPALPRLPGSVLVALRVLGFLLWTILCGLPQAVLIFLPGRPKVWVALAYWWGCCWLLGLQVRVTGAPMMRDMPVVFIGNHSSWLDIPVIGSRLPACFIAKGEVGTWPVISIISRLGRTVLVSRRAAGAARENAEIRRRLEQGDSLVLFPEGTTSDGCRVMPFRSAFLAVAESEVPHRLQPFTLVYDGLDYLPVRRADRSLFAWFGDMELASHFNRIARQRGLRATIVLHPPIDPKGGLSRKQLAQQTWHQVAVSAAEIRRNRD